MKLSKLFVLGIFGLMSLNVGAADIIDREAPDLSSVEETPVPFEVGKTYILYNTGAEMYFTQGSTWSTRGCVVPNKTSAVLIRVAKYTLNDAWDGKTYEIENYVTPRTGSYAWYKMCMNSAGDLYLDQTSWSRFVELQDQGENVYRIMPNEVNNTVEGDNGGVVSDGTQFVGYAGLAWDGGGSQYDFGKDDNEERVPLTALTDQNVDWVFYSTEAYDAAMEIFNKAEELKKIINTAEEMGVDVSAAVSVYNNTSSTMAEIEAQIKALGEAIAAQSGVVIEGTADAPGDATEAITNPNFDGASYDGWLGEPAPNMVGSGSHGPADVAEHYNHNFDTYQNLYGLPAGVYGLSAYTFYRGSWDDYVNGTNRNAFLYATSGDETQKSAFANPWEAQNASSMAGSTYFGTSAGEISQKDEETGITYYIPNDPSAGRLYFEKGFYYNAVAFGVTGGSARIGVKKETAVTNDWSVFDTFGLRYYGNEGAASYASWLGENASMLYANGAKTTQSYVDAFLAVINSQKANVTDATSANNAYIALKGSDELAALQENIALWGQWETAVNDAQKYTEGDYSTLNAAMELGDYISEADFAEGWDNDRIKAEIQSIATMVEAVLDEMKMKVEPNTDVTGIYIGDEDAKFNKGIGGWTVEGDGVNSGAGCLEAYNQQFDLYKIVDNPQVGVYELELQGFFRLERDQTAFDMYNRGEQDKTKAWIYINEVKSYVKSVFDEDIPGGEYEDGSHGTDGQYWVDSETDNWYPNTMTSASEAFNAGLYKTTAYGFVSGSGEQLRIGVTGNMKGANWMIWDNFKLIYRGMEPNVINPILISALENLDTESPMGKSVYKRAIAAKSAAESAIGGSDGQSMFNALKAIYAVENDVEESVKIFAELMTAIEGLIELNSSDDAEVTEFIETVMGNIEEHSYENEDVPELLIQVKKFRTKLRLPADYAEASELNPIDMPIIDTPTFDDGEGANSVDGWNADGYNFGNDETQKSALALEFYNKTFDLNQTIYGVPAGNYILKVNSFARLDAEKTNPVYLYAVTGGEEFKIELVDLVDDGSIGDMVSAVAAFDEGNYLNELPVTVGADGVLRIGIKKETNETSTTDWVIMDNWSLWYIGNGGAITIIGDVNGDGSVDVADISAIISQMAGTATYPAADVNNDGSVDVADISKVISIMAEKARLAKAAIGEE